MSQDTFTAGFPPELRQIIDTHRAWFGGFRMMADEAPPEGEQAPPNQGEQAPQQTPPPSQEAEDVSKLPKWAQRLIEETRKEAGDARTNAKAAAADEARKELAQEIGKALGLVKGDEEVDPKKLAADLKAAQDTSTEATRQLAVFRLAGKAGGDADALLDSNSFLKSIAGLDPTDDAKITAAIQDAVKANSKLAATRAVGKSGSDSVGHGEGAKKADPTSLEDAIKQDQARQANS